MEGDTQSEEKAASVLEELHQLSAKVFFNKTLTVSDTSGSGRVVIPKVGLFFVCLIRYLSAPMTELAKSDCQASEEHSTHDLSSLCMINTCLLPLKAEWVVT